MIYVRKNGEVGGYKKADIGPMTPTSEGLRYPCYECERENTYCNPCSVWVDWFRSKWRDLRRMCGYQVEEFEEE